MTNYLEGLDTFLTILLVTCLISIPLGIWKLVEIIIWIFEHVSITP